MRPSNSRFTPFDGVSSVLLVGVAAFYLLFLASTAVYLGWADAAHHLARPVLWQRLGLTLSTALISTGVAMIVGIPGGYALARLPLPIPRVLATVIELPMMVPPATVGVFLIGAVATPPVAPLLKIAGISLGHSTAGVILCQVAVTTSFAVCLCGAAFASVPVRVETVARTLGATWPRAALGVTLPAARNALLGATLTVFARAAAEWEAVMLFVGASRGATDVLPFAVFLDWNEGMMGGVVTMSLMSVTVATLASLGASLARRSSHVG